MTREELNKGYVLSEYNEGTEEQLDYYIDERACNKGDSAYLYSHEDNEIRRMEIVEVICRSDNRKFYDGLSEDVLLLGEDKYDADTSAEFITDHDCYLVWFRYV